MPIIDVALLSLLIAKKLGISKMDLDLVGRRNVT